MAKRSRCIVKTRAERNIEWCEDHLRLPEGKFVGQKLTMAPFMKADFKEIYDNPVGTRRAIITRGRKNAKTCECAFILLLHLCGVEHKKNSQLYSIAQSRDQAAILFSLAAKMVRMSPALRDAIVIRDTAKELLCPELGTNYKALSAETTTAFGLSPVLTIFDEAGQVRGPKSTLYEAMETATAAQEQPLTIVISTQAPTDGDFLSVLIDDAIAGHDSRVVLRMDYAPPEMDAFSEEAIQAANPALDLFMNKAEVLAMAADAKRMPSRQPEYENLVLNRRIETSSPFVSHAVWRACGNPPKPLQGLRVYGGLDLSAVNDLTALVLIGQSETKWHVHPTFWLPAEGLRERARTDRVPYDVWQQQGHLEATPGKSVDYEYVALWLKQLFQDEQLDIVRIGFDPWKFQALKQWLLKVGFSEQDVERHFVEVGQGYKSMTPALRTLEGELLNGRVAHGMHPVLSMCAENAVVVHDPAGNSKLDKSKSIRRIDGMVALAISFAVAEFEADKPEPKYQMYVL
jgi:phage terminase large subunit-like protein